MNPEYDIMTSGQKIESSHRTLSGANYRYIWGSFPKVRLNVAFLSSADMTSINSWWGANVPVRVYDLNSIVVVSGYIANVDKPISRLVPPYTDQFAGTIELEGF